MTVSAESEQAKTLAASAGLLYDAGDRHWRLAATEGPHSYRHALALSATLAGCELANLTTEQVVPLAREHGAGERSPLPLLREACRLLATLSPEVHGADVAFAVAKRVLDEAEAHARQ